MRLLFYVLSNFFYTFDLKGDFIASQGAFNYNVTGELAISLFQRILKQKLIKLPPQ